MARREPGIEPANDRDVHGLGGRLPEHPDDLVGAVRVGRGDVERVGAVVVVVSVPDVRRPAAERLDERDVVGARDLEEIASPTTMSTIRSSACSMMVVVAERATSSDTERSVGWTSSRMGGSAAVGSRSGQPASRSSTGSRS